MDLSVNPGSSRGQGLPAGPSVLTGTVLMSHAGIAGRLGSQGCLSRSREGVRMAVVPSFPSVPLPGSGRGNGLCG